MLVNSNHFDLSGTTGCPHFLNPSGWMHTLTRFVSAGSHNNGDVRTRGVIVAITSCSMSHLTLTTHLAIYSLRRSVHIVFPRGTTAPQEVYVTIQYGALSGWAFACCISDADAFPRIMCTGVQNPTGGRCKIIGVPYACKPMKRKRIHKRCTDNEHPARHPILEIGPSYVLPLHSRLLFLRSASVLRNDGGRPACVADARCSMCTRTSGF